MVAYIEAHKDRFGVEPICAVLPIAPSTYYEHQARNTDPNRQPPRQRRDEALGGEIRRVWEENFGVYGARKVWRQLRREGFEVARCTVERLMRTMGLQGVVRGKKVVTTNPDAAQPCPDDKVNRAFVADMPNQLWVSDFTYVSSWQGMVYVAFIIDVFARKIVGWRVSTSMTTGFVLDALNQAICQRAPSEADKLIHHSDRGSQYASQAFQDLLREHNITCSMSRKGNCWDNAMMESFFATLKKELIYHESYPTREAARQSVFEYIELFYNTRRRHSALGYLSPDQFEQAAQPNEKK